MTIEMEEDDMVPVEESLITVVYGLVREVQTLARRVELGDFDQVKKLEKELD